jgi:hypothetical protein
MYLFTTPCIERVGHGFTIRQTYLAWAQAAIQDRGVARTVAHKMLEGNELYPWNPEEPDVYETFAVTDRHALKAQLSDEEAAAIAHTVSADGEPILRVIVDHQADVAPNRTVRAGYMTPTDLGEWLGVGTGEGAAIIERLRHGIPHRDRRGEEDVYLIAASAIGHPQPVVPAEKAGVELRELYDQGCRGLADVNMDELLWRIFADVESSYQLALYGAGVANATIAQVSATVQDYLANHYGSD